MGTGACGDTQIRVAIRPLPPLAELEPLWRSLETRANASYFISWPWIRNWATLIQPAYNPELLTATIGDRYVVGAALIVRRVIWRRQIVPLRSWILHATGDPDVDAVCTEYNGLLVDCDYEAAAWRAVLDHFVQQGGSADELRLDGIPVSVLSALNGFGRARESYRQTARSLQLGTVREAGGALQLVGAPTRANIRRTERAFERQYGRVTLESAVNAGQALDFLAELRQFHEARWTPRNGGGAFSHKFFGHFHERLIESAFDTGTLQLLRVRAGERTVAVLYNFVDRNDVYFYLSGIDYRLVTHGESPGMLAQVKAIEHNAALGYGRYDMLAGDHAYKKALAPNATELWWGSVQRPRMKLQLERVAEQTGRYLKRRLPDVLVYGPPLIEALCDVLDTTTVPLT